MNETLSIDAQVRQLAQSAKAAFYDLANASTGQKNEALLHAAKLIETHEADILAANAQDMARAREKSLEPALLDRLEVSAKGVRNMAEGLRQVAALPDPIGQMSDFAYRPSGIQVGKMRVPLGVIGMIYESRPNVTVDAAALCLKSGNACVLRGGSEAIRSNTILAQLLHEALRHARLPESAIGFIDNTDRAGVGVMLQLPQFIDVIIPRGGKSLVARISAEARVPVIKHLDGVCHVYLDDKADADKALAIALNAKTSRYGTCNTMETLLVHALRAEELLPPLQAAYREHGVQLRADEAAQRILGESVIAATEEDWSTEYLAPILSIKVVQDMNEAIEHINHYGSHHTDSIVTDDYGHAREFLRRVDSASVMVNASTRFADGFEFGLGAEIGISTDKIHVRGPVGLEGLTTQKWIVLGDGQIRA